ncbi:type II toxin-antitoxin system RelE/ParE family toxin [Halomonas citrativorans]|uniref:Type II toxin-antitoxin system RelE/ParE family toxin n=1 Tax=Halomonas citrativorans TaxID=2742612 RepID=A0ABR9F9N3_9GAMM|nr:type II toxin-antitoxin system RelE/ParE family toxin [Halomonas citrativorans]MBE0403169.1 type II toxin-antitoxin system RelE/ParE family toxin [Halomonas citrativorans]
MRVFKNKVFTKWAAKEGLGDAALLAAVEEMERGMIDANLGAHVVKKRVAVGGRGKSGGVRTLLAYKVSNKAFFVYGFAKNARVNISANELNALKYLAKELLAYSDEALVEAINHGVLIEVENDG